MRVIIAGSRHINDPRLVQAAIDKANVEITEVVSGGAKGVDKLGEDYARREGLPIKCFPADWDKFGRGAGPIRNQEMAEYADFLIALPIKGSRGTKDMIRRMKTVEKPYYIHDTSE